MKFLRIITFILSACLLLMFSNCKDKEEGMTEEEKKTEMLTSKSWTISDASQVVVPANSATTESDWVGFTVNATASSMSTSGHPTGANVVWPTGDWNFNSDLTKITREDGVQMTVNDLSETSFSVTFTVADGTELGDRVAALDGEYTFNLE